ncbi:hypothetical protein ACFL47_11080, partial [Candidatus Latescibacterota bacterium]
SSYPGEMRELWDRSRPYLHIRNYGYGYPQGVTNLSHEMDDARIRGQEVWFYNNKAIQSTDRSCARMFFGMWGWKVGADGLTTWTYPGGRTIQFELVREGIDDSRYLNMLERLIDEKAGNLSDREDAQRFLDMFRRSITLDKNGYITNWSSTMQSAAEKCLPDVDGQDPFLLFKHRIGDFIRKLSSE